MAVRSRRFFNLVASVTGVLAYTVPAGRTALIRTLIVRNHGPLNGARVAIAINGVNTADDYVWSSTVLAANDVDVMPTFVLNPGDTLHLVTFAVADVVTCSAYGSLLDGAPS